MKRLFDGLCGLLAAVALFAIMGLTLADVLGRKLLNHSITGSLELTEILMVVVIFAAIACSLPQTRHRWQPGPVVGGRARRHWRPLAMAPPRT